MRLIGLALGIGLVNALMQALSYLCSRCYVSLPDRSTQDLMGWAHLWMGLFSLAALPFLWHEPAAGWGAVAWPLAGAAGFYLFAQNALFWTLRRIAASRVAPMLGFKIAILAVAATALGLESLNWMQWLGAGLAVAATALINRSGDPLPWSALGGLLACCLGYAGSDLSIRFLQRALRESDTPGEKFWTACFTAALIYTLCMAYGGVLLLWRRRHLHRPDPLYALPFAATWYLGMIFLFTSISLSGVVLAIILQSTRGPMSIGLALAVGALGWFHLEEKRSGAVLLKQFLTAMLMCGAIALYVLGKAQGDSAPAPAPAPEPAPAVGAEAESRGRASPTAPRPVARRMTE